MLSFFSISASPNPIKELRNINTFGLLRYALLHLALSATPHVIISEYLIRLELRSVYDLCYIDVQINKSVIFLLHFRIPDSNQGIATDQHFWLGKIGRGGLY